jgi:F0F1-type ATP synthase membrane subunit c/vacuolar-type H+-ATPase subunit K
MNNEELKEGNGNKQPEVDISLWKWVSKYFKKKKIASISISGVILAVFNLVLPFLSKIEKNIMLPLLYGIQVLFIIFFVGIIAFGPKPKIDKVNYYRGSIAVMQFWDWWPILWSAWALLYLLLTVTSIPPRINNNNFNLDIINNIATLILLMLFHILVDPSVTVENQGDSHNSNDNGGHRIAKLMFWILLFIVLTFVEIPFVIGHKAETVQRISIFSKLYGILAGTATALVVGRLDSKLLGIPKAVIIVLFIYAAQQPAFDFIIGGDQKNPNAVENLFKTFLIAFALVSKIVFFVVIQWLAMEGRLLFFMDKSYEIHNNVKNDRKEFLEKIGKKSSSEPNPTKNNVS